ncbi:MAG: peptidylprolyl isomerase [Acidobacteria bacterium]|nr:peptidylprolyl isomerase [Acidobacteriota bacterium]
MNFLALLLFLVPGSDALKDPSQATLTAPETFKVRFTTSKGDVVISVTRAWSPFGADRFYNLVKAGYFDRVPFYRVVPGFVTQFGFHPDPQVNRAWNEAKILDDASYKSNYRGTIVFATAGPNTRTCQFFINTVDNLNLDAMGFTPFGEVSEGMDVVENIFSGYGQNPNQTQIRENGAAYLNANFPDMDYILSAKVE